MGIQGLLPLLKSIMVPVHIKELEGCSVAVDTYSWLHKGALSCSIQLCKGEPTTRYIDYCMHRVNLLRHYGVKPVLVFDGGLLPMKGEQENKRARARKENLARALEHESNGNSSAAFEYYQKAVDISPAIAYELIQVLKKENICYIVAPYEADAQMTFLAVSQQVDAVITEDSDLIPFGCPRIIFKMDKFGQAVQFRSSMIQQNKELSLIGFSNQMILEMCILSGCDYLQSLPGMGLKRAHALIKKFQSHDKVIKHLQYSGVSVSPLYEESFRKAIWTFRHQLVYNPTVEDVVHLSKPCDDIGNNLDFLGPVIPQDIAKGIAIGELDPFTKLPFQGKTVNAKADPSDTYQLKMFKPESVRKKLELPAQRNLLTNYFCFASLEAKRKFTAPRTTAGSPNMMESSSPIPREDTEGGSSACKTAYKPDHETLNSLPLEDSVEDGIMFKLPEFSGRPYIKGSDDMRDVGNFIKGHGSLHQPSRYVHKPCLALREECELMYSSDAVESKTNLNDKKINLKSSYFQHKVANENDGKDTKAIESLEDAAASDVTPEDSCKERPSKGPQLKRKIAHANIIQTIENGKVIRRSSYFQQKAAKKMDYNNENEMFSAKNDVTSDSCQTTILESPSPEKSIKGLYSKTKTPPTYHMETENEIYKENISLPSQGGSASDLDQLDVETKFDEEKFGSNISHLDRYSDIAEKSVDNFVSMISSFRYSSSGSRASGLRAPLKDVRNTSSNRFTAAAMAISKFSYVPKKRKTNPIFHRS